MTGQLFIDGKDAYRQFGIFITQDAYNELLAYPPLKKVESIDWAEEDGEEVDLASPMLNSRELTLKFAAHRRMYTGDFIALISDGAYHRFDFRDLGRSYTLRMVSQAGLKHHPNLEVFSLQVADDFPAVPSLAITPGGGRAPTSGYELDGVDLSKYGVCVLQGAVDELLESASVKQNLLRNLTCQHGAIYDGGRVRFKAKDLKLPLLMRADSMAEFWRNYDALLCDLIRPEERILHAEATGSDYRCYYKKCAVSEFSLRDRVWFKFNLTLVLTSFRIGADEVLLSSEDRAWISTEDGACAIDLHEL